MSTWNDPLPIDEFRRRVDAPRDPREAEANLDLVRWFTKQYPTAKERLRYIRRKARELARRPRIEPPER